MNLQVVSASARDIDADWLIVGVPETGEWDSELVALDSALQEQLSRLREAGAYRSSPHPNTFSQRLARPPAISPPSMITGCPVM